MKKSPLFLSIGGLVAMAAGVGVGRFVYTAILPPMVEALHLSKSEAGLIASANFVGYLCGALLATLRLPGSRRTWLLGALAANAAGLAAMGLTTNLGLFLVIRLLAGGFSAFALVYASGLVIQRLNAAGRPQLSAVHFAGVGAGIAVSAATVALLRDWHAMWFASALLCVAAAVAVAFLVPADDRATAAPLAQGRAPVALIVAYGLFGFGYVITATFIVAQVRGAPAIAPLEPYVWVLFGLSAAPSVAFWTALGRRWGILNAYAVAAVVEAVGVAGSAIWTNEVTITGAALLVGGTFMGLTALGLIAASGRIALMTASFGLGQILGPLFAGYVFDATGSLTVPLLGAAATLIVAATLVLFVPQKA